MKKTLLRYPGGKSRASKIIADYFPKDIKTIGSPFFGGGAVEWELASRDVNIIGNDLFLPVAAFWRCVQKDRESLADRVKANWPMKDKETFYNLQKTLRELLEDCEFSGWEWPMAERFFVLNRSSYSGSTLSGGMSPNTPRFTENSIEAIRKFRLIEKLEGLFYCLDFSKFIGMHNNLFLYCDPPYYLEGNKNKLYGNKGDHHEGFRHDLLADRLGNHYNGWILSYNDCEWVRETYKDYRIETPEWKYGMSKDKSSNELLIIKE